MPCKLAATAILFAVAGSCASESLHWGTAALRDYKQAFRDELGDRFVGDVAWTEFTANLRASRVLWLGDHHGDRALHEAQLDLLRRLSADGFRIALGLEAIGWEDEDAVARYLDGGDFARLRRAVKARWPGSWLDDPGLDAGFYRDLVQRARAGRWPVFALEPVPRLPLRARDAVIADSVRAAAQRHGDRLVVVVVGQAHLLGQGNLVQATGLKGLAIGAEPGPALRAAVPAVKPANEFLRASSGVLFFVDLL